MKLCDETARRAIKCYTEGNRPELPPYAWFLEDVPDPEGRAEVLHCLLSFQHCRAALVEIERNVLSMALRDAEARLRDQQRQIDQAGGLARVNREECLKSRREVARLSQAVETLLGRVNFGTPEEREAFLDDYLKQEGAQG